MSSLGSFVATRRKTLGLTQQSLADALGYTVQAISKFENGQSEMDLSSLPELAKTLRLSLDDLFHEKSESTTPCSIRFDQTLLAKNLSYLRLAKGLTQDQVAEAVHVSKRSIANYEAGISTPTPTTILCYLDTFKIEADRLFGTALAPESVPSPKKKSKKPWIMLLAVLLVLGLAAGIGVPLILNANKGSSSSSANSYSSSYTTSSTTSLSSGTTTLTSDSTASKTSASSVNAFAGLNAFEILHQGVADEILSPGTYAIDIMTSPANYFTDHGVQLGWSWASAQAGVSLTTVTDPYASQSIVIASSALHQAKAVLSLTAIQNGASRTANFTVTVNNPTSEIDAVHFPGIEYFYLTYQGEASASLSPGTYLLDAVIGPSHPDFSSGYAFGQISFPTNITGASSHVAFESISLWISDSCADGLKVTVRASLAQTSTQVHFSSSPDFIVTVRNPGVS